MCERPLIPTLHTYERCTNFVRYCLGLYFQSARSTPYITVSGY